MRGGARGRLCWARLYVSDLPPAFILGFAFILGATWGSFFNVAIYRWPRDMSVVTPPSHCPACGAPIPGWRNVPIFAYLIQRGRAACCGAKMTPRYLFVEVLSGVLAVALAQRFMVHAPSGTTLNEAGLVLITWFVFVGGLVIATFVDLEHMEIPDEVSIGGTALGLATMSLRITEGAPTPLELALGAGTGYLVVMLLLVWGWERLTGRRGMGEGDAKLMLFIGVFLGWQGVLFALVGGSVQGVLAVLVGRAMGRPITAGAASDGDAKTAEVQAGAEATAAGADGGVAEGGVAEGGVAEGVAEGQAEASPGAQDENEEEAEGGLGRIPFGPFLALGALEFLFFGRQITDAYLAWALP